MKLAFFVSSIGDTDLALSTINAIEAKGKHEINLISLTKTAQDRIATFQSSIITAKKTLPELIGIEDNVFPAGACSKEQIEKLVQYMKDIEIEQVYCGVPSVNSHIPFQIAAALVHIPVLMAYEFMFKQETHCLWDHLPILKSKPNIQWAVPLHGAMEDLGIEDKSKMHVVGHLSIDNGLAPRSASGSRGEDLAIILQAEKTKNDESRKSLQLTEGKSFAFVSSTTQPLVIDRTFLECLLSELPKHPNVDVRLGLHPGIEDLDVYLTEILSVYKRHHDGCHEQFKIILPDNILAKLKNPMLTVSNPEYEHVFLRVNINGTDAAAAADRVAQAVPGALLNQAVLEGKAAFTHFGKPYLPHTFFSSTLGLFFTKGRQPSRNKEELGLDEKTVSERCTEIFIK